MISAPTRGTYPLRTIKGAEPKRRQWALRWETPSVTSLRASRIKRGGSPVNKGVLRLKEQYDHCELRKQPLDVLPALTA